MNRLTLLLASPSLSALALDLNVSELGLPPNSEKNATPIVRKALEKINQSGGGTLTFPKGTYHFHAEGCRVSKNASDGPYPKFLRIILKHPKYRIFKNVTH